MGSGLEDNAAELAVGMESFISDLMIQPDREQVASEIGGEYIWFLGSRALSECMHHTFPLAVLQSIYGDNAIHLWHGPRVGGPKNTSDGGCKSNEIDTIRYVVSLK